jgi:hypothetical protein
VLSPIHEGLLWRGGEDVIISGTADAADAAKVELSFDGGQSWQDGNFNSSARTWWYVWNTSGLASGNYSVISRLLHGTSTATAEPLTLRLDADDPVVQAPNGGILKGGGSIHLEGNVSDNVGVAMVEMSIEGPGQTTGWTGAALSSGNTSWSLDWRTDHLSSGDYSVSVRATDIAGRMGLANVTITLDFEPPLVTFSTSGLFRGGPTVRLEGTVSDNIRLEGVTIRGAGNGPVANVEGGLWSFDWNTTGLPSGKYVLMAVAEDAAGWNASASSTPTLDADVPRFDIDWPKTAEAGSIVALTGNVLDENGLAVAEISTDGENWTELEPDDSGGWAFDWDSSALMPGNISVSVRASDIVGNQGSITDVIRLVDTTPPRITVEMAREIQAGEVLRVNVKLVERTGIGTVELSTDGKEWKPMTPVAKGYSADIATTNLSLGNNKIRVRVWDTEGNMGDATKDVTVVDDKAPVLAITGLFVEKQGLTASGSASDNYRLKSLEYSVDGARWTPLELAAGSWNLTLANFKPGKYVFKVRATDTSGLTTEAARDFDVQAPRPAQKGLLPGFELAGAVLSILAAIAMAYVLGPRRRAQKG